MNLETLVAENAATPKNPTIPASTLSKELRAALSLAMGHDGESWTRAVAMSEWQNQADRDAFQIACRVRLTHDEHVRRSKKVEGLWVVQRGRRLTFYVSWAEGRGDKAYAVTYFFHLGRAFLLSSTSIFGLGRSKRAHETSDAIREAVYGYNWHFAHHVAGDWQRAIQQL